MTIADATAPLDKLRAVLAEISDLQHTEMLLDWDSRVFMPHAGARSRADTASTVGRPPVGLASTRAAATASSEPLTARYPMTTP